MPPKSTRNGTVNGTPIVAGPTPKQGPTPPIEPPIFGGVGPLMIASMPAAASGADVYARQFYRGSRVPFRRYLPVSVE